MVDYSSSILSLWGGGGGEEGRRELEGDRK